MFSSLIIQIVNLIVHVYSCAILVYCVFSFFPSKPGMLGAIYNVLSIVCDPVLNIFRKIIPPIGGMLDISPIIALFVISGLARVLSFIFYILPF